MWYGFLLRVVFNHTIVVILYVSVVINVLCISLIAFVFYCRPQPPPRASDLSLGLELLASASVSSFSGNSCWFVQTLIHAHEVVNVTSPVICQHQSSVAVQELQLKINISFVIYVYQTKIKPLLCVAVAIVWLFSMKRIILAVFCRSINTCSIIAICWQNSSDFGWIHYCIQNKMVENIVSHDRRISGYARMRDTESATVAAPVWLSGNPPLPKPTTMECKVDDTDKRLSSDKSYLSQSLFTAPPTPMLSESTLTPQGFHVTAMEDVQEWLAYFVRYVTFKQLSEPATVTLFALLMHSAANTWFSALDEAECNDFKTLRERFAQKYAPAPINMWKRASDFWTHLRQPMDISNGDCLFGLFAFI